MKVGIEAQRIFRKNKHGMDVVALETLRELQQTGPENQFILFASNGPDFDCFSPSSRVTLQLVSGLTYGDWEQVSLPAALKRLVPDLVHCTANTAPLRCPVPLVLTLHDIIYMEDVEMKGSTYQNLGNLYRRFVVPRVIQTAKRIVTVSGFEKEVISARFPEAAEKLEVVYNGVGQRFRPIGNREERINFRKRLHLPENFMLFLGNTAPKKNTENLIKAYVHYCYIERDPLPIVITDYARERVNRILEELNKPELISRFVLPGYIPAEQMPLLYNNASLFLYPSLRESFGLPVLEAMACGVPVITSNVSALPEVAGNAAVYINPLEIENMAQAIVEVLTDEPFSTEMVHRGFARAEMFSWKNTASKMLEVYRSIL